MHVPLQTASSFAKILPRSISGKGPAPVTLNISPSLSL